MDDRLEDLIETQALAAATAAADKTRAILRQHVEQYADGRKLLFTTVAVDVQVHSEWGDPLEGLT